MYILMKNIKHDTSSQKVKTSLECWPFTKACSESRFSTMLKSTSNTKLNVSFWHFHPTFFRLSGKLWVWSQTFLHAILSQSRKNCYQTEILLYFYWSNDWDLTPKLGNSKPKCEVSLVTEVRPLFAFSSRFGSFYRGMTIYDWISGIA